MTAATAVATTAAKERVARMKDLFFEEGGKRKEWKTGPVATDCHGRKAQALNRLTTCGAETARRARRKVQAACQRGRRASDCEGRNLKNFLFPEQTDFSGQGPDAARPHSPAVDWGDLPQCPLSNWSDLPQYPLSYWSDPPKVSRR